MDKIKTETITVQVYPDGRVDTKNASLYLGFSVKSLATYRTLGTGPHYIKRGRVFYYIDDLDEWIKKFSRVTSTAQNGHNK